MGSADSSGDENTTKIAKNKQKSTRNREIDWQRTLELFLCGAHGVGEIGTTAQLHAGRVRLRFELGDALLARAHLSALGVDRTAHLLTKSSRHKQRTNELPRYA